MKIEYSLLALGMALIYGIVIKFLPDFPISVDVLLALLVYVLTKLGVEVVAPAVRKYFNK